MTQYPFHTGIPSKPVFLVFSNWILVQKFLKSRFVVIFSLPPIKSKLSGRFLKSSCIKIEGRESLVAIPDVFFLFGKIKHSENRTQKQGVKSCRMFS
jgi:hypothetical protein